MFHAEAPRRRDWIPIILRVSAPRRAIWPITLVIYVVLASSMAAAEEVSVETVLRGLSNPCGVAVRPGGSAVGFEVFVADTGAGRIVKVALNKSDNPTDVVTGFAMAGSGAGPLETSGPRGLLFWGRRHMLAVCGDGQEDLVRSYVLPDDEAPLKAGDARQTLTVPKLGDTGGLAGRRLFGLARTKINDRVPDLIVVTALGGTTRGWLGKAAVRSDALGELTPFATSADQASPIRPSAITVSDKGYVVVGQQNKSKMGVLVFYNPIDGAPLLELPTTMHEMTGLAYSEETQNLYACDFAAGDPQQGGVFRLDDTSRPGEPACRAVKIATVARPTALAFGPDGAMYVTACGPADGKGVLVRITQYGGAL